MATTTAVPRHITSEATNVLDLLPQEDAVAALAYLRRQVRLTQLYPLLRNLHHDDAARELNRLMMEDPEGVYRYLQSHDGYHDATSEAVDAAELEAEKEARAQGLSDDAVKQAMEDAGEDAAGRSLDIYWWHSKMRQWFDEPWCPHAKMLRQQKWCPEDYQAIPERRFVHDVR